ncbi:MAG: TolC family protein [Verrucomicrobiae bacterium]|nr:TolC family protein [Verrucomicrobiae bacterium]
MNPSPSAFPAALKALALAASLAAAGLAAADEEDAPASPESAWAPPARVAREAGALPAAALRENLPPADRRMSLLELVDLALGRHPATRQAWASARQAAAQLGAARSRYWPTLTLGASAGKSATTQPTYPGFSTVDQWVGAPQLSLTWLLLDFGGRHAGVEAAREALFASNFQFNQTVQSVVYGVTRGYYLCDTAQGSLDAAEANLRLADTTLELFVRKARVGLATETDLLQARQAQAQAVYDLEAARGGLKTARAGLAQALGMPANAPVSIAPPEGAPSLATLDRQADQLVDLALRQRPDLSAKYANLLALKAQARQADAAIWPAISAQASGSRTFYDAQTDANGKSFSGDSHYNQGSAMLVMSVDLFDGLNLVNKARAARAAAEAAQADLANAELAATAEVVIAYSDVQTAAKKYAAGQILLEASRRAFEAMQIGSQAGLDSALDLLTAQNNLASASARNVQARSDLFLATARLANATGSLLPPPKLARSAARPAAAVSEEALAPVEP